MISNHHKIKSFIGIYFCRLLSSIGVDCRLLALVSVFGVKIYVIFCFTSLDVSGIMRAKIVKSAGPRVKMASV